MDIKDIKLKKGMSKEEVNELISEWIELEDDIYMGNAYKHNWVCRCGNIIEGRMWNKVKGRESIRCFKCTSEKQENRYRHEVEKNMEYEYIRSYRKHDILPNGNKVGDQPIIEVRHIFCDSIYTISATGFINDNKRCGKCCGSYEKSIAYHIEVELMLKLEDVWDFNKNNKYPNTISKYTHNKVWFKCQDVGYHGSYSVSVNNFMRAVNKNNTFGCPYCHGKKTHPRDSFAQYHIDNTDPDFLEKYWDYDKNTVDPFEISPSSNKNKVWIKCQNEEVNELNGLKKKDYHGSYEVYCNDFTSNIKLSHKLCACNICTGYQNFLHQYDSFGYHNLDKVMSWSPNNDISPFRVARNSGKKYEFICPECSNEFSKRIAEVSSRGSFCNHCSKSRGERRIVKWLHENNISYISEKEYDELIGVGGNNLRYDFYLQDYDMLLEYDGEFHYEDRYKDGRFKKQKTHDRLKNKYAKDNDIKLIRIPYWDFDNIEEILNKEIIDSNKLI